MRGRSWRAGQGRAVGSGRSKIKERRARTVRNEEERTGKRG